MNMKEKIKIGILLTPLIPFLYLQIKQVIAGANEYTVYALLIQK